LFNDYTYLKIQIKLLGKIIEYEREISTRKRTIMKEILEKRND